MGRHTLDDPIRTADVVLLAATDHAEDEHALLIRRAYPPYAGYWALPGGHVDPGECARGAAARALTDETGLGLAPAVFTEVGVFDTPGRDPRGSYVATAYLARMQLPAFPAVRPADDAASAQWVPLARLDRLAVDHLRIAHAAAITHAPVLDVWNLRHTYPV